MEGYMFNISESIKENLNQLFLKIHSSPHKKEQFGNFLSQAVQGFGEVSFEVIERLIHIRDSAADGFLIVRNLPTDHEVPLTPYDWNAVTEKSTQISEACLAMFSGILGRAYNYRSEGVDSFFRNIVPIHQKHPKNLNTYFGAYGLGMHTEHAYHPLPPDFVLLYCIRGDPTAVTTVSNLNCALENLSQRTIALLQREDFKFTAPESLFDQIPECERLSPATAILRRINGTFELRLRSFSMIAANQEAQKALLQLNTELDRCAVRISMKSGDLMVINNRKSSHSRTKYDPKFDGKDRWLQQLFVRKEICLDHPAVEDFFF
ncbi:MAG: TauD/TfdA family dioxygenase [bacterium]|nr:TauD/TfdA family dioxygenase [bacterium]